MHRDMELLQGGQQTFQPVRQGDGRGGIGQQEGAGDQHKDTPDHEESALQPLGGNGQGTQAHQLHAAVGIENVQDRRKDQDEYQRLHSPHNGFWGNGGNFDTHQQEHQHQRIGDPVLGDKQRYDVHHSQNQLGSRIHPMNGGVAGEKLPQGDILKHGRVPPSAGSGSPPPDRWCTRCPHPAPCFSDPGRSGSPWGYPGPYRSAPARG